MEYRSHPRIDVVDDTVSESDETFTVTLSEPTSGGLGAHATHTVTIADDDAAPPADDGGGGGALEERQLLLLLVLTFVQPLMRFFGRVKGMPAAHS
jgi:hypothetical protein